MSLVYKVVLTKMQSYRKSAFSFRMNQYLKVWDEISSGPCAKNMKTEVPYFCDGDQLREVAVYLQKFISEKLK